MVQHVMVSTWFPRLRLSRGISNQCSRLSYAHIYSINDVPATCSKFRDETQYAMSQITFDFRNPEKFLDFFMRTRRDMHSKIRNITVKAFPFPMYPSKSASSYITWDFSNVLPFVRGLRLDRLTVFDCFHDPDTNDGWGDMATYHLIDGLVSADGWKELHVVSPTAEFLQWGDPATSNEAFSSTRRKAQPDQWNETLRTKDDNKLGSFVKLYRESKVGTGTERAELCVAVFQPEGKGIEVDTRSDVEILTTLENAASDGIAPDNRSNNIAWSRYNNPYPDKRRVSYLIL